MGFLHHINLSRKFLILGLIALVMAVVPTYLHIGTSLTEMRDSRAEVDGMAPLIALQKVIQVSQQHRGLSAGMLAGNESMKARRPAVRDSVRAAIAGVDKALQAAGASSELQNHWTQRKQAWQTLEQSVEAGQMTAAESTRQHTLFIAAVLHLNTELLDEFRLTLDGSLDTHDLILASFVSGPWLTEKLGIMRAMGSGFLTQGSLPPQGKGTLMGLKDRVAELNFETMDYIDSANRLNPAFAADLAKASQSMRAQIEQTLAMADKQLINATEINFPPTQYFDEFTKTIDVVYQFNDLAMKALQKTLSARAQNMSNQVMLVLGLQLLILVVAIVLGLAFVRSITVPMQQSVRLATAVSNGDLTQSLPEHGSNETGQLLEALGAMQSQLSRLVAGVRADAEGVASGSSQIASGNNDLSARTEQAASALEETAASMEELNSHVRKNAAHAQEANELARQAQDIAVKGGEVVEQVVKTMQRINTASHKISDIISVIDGIAFQTNILALNAAVEAARAGEQGRGFAVVAGEVRTLAQRSAQAAKEITGLINDSVQGVEEGSALVDQAGHTMTEVVASIRRVTLLMSDISTASSEQSASVAEVGQAVSQMDQATQQNAALVEEMAAAAASLDQQARKLVQAVDAFNTGSKMAAVSEPVTSAHRSKASAAPAAKVQTPVMPLPLRRPASPTTSTATLKLPPKPVATSASHDEDAWDTF